MYRVDPQEVYWFYKDNYFNEHMVCTECTPTEFYDGSKNKEAGKWHNMFPKKHWSDYGSKEELIEISKQGKGGFTNAIEFFKERGMK